MQTSIDLPQAFSVREENEFFPIQHLLDRLNPKLIVTRVATGRHINGGPTVVWGLVHLAGRTPAKDEVETALKQAGYDFSVGGPIHSSCLWGAES